jgi:hypothetical protein
MAMALGQAAVARALLIVFTQVTDFVAAEWTTVQWSGDAGFTTTHFANTVGLVRFRKRRRVGPERRLPVVAENEGEPLRLTPTACDRMSWSNPPEDSGSSRAMGLIPTH